MRGREGSGGRQHVDASWVPWMADEEETGRWHPKPRTGNRLDTIFPEAGNGVLGEGASLIGNRGWPTIHDRNERLAA